MMAAPRTANRAMFWRILRRLLGANRGRLFVMLLALGAGAAVTAALLNLQVDAKRRLTTEFRAFGANVIISPTDSTDRPGLLNESLFEQVPGHDDAGEVSKVAFLYSIAGISPYDSAEKSPNRKVQAILVGYAHSGPGAGQLLPPALVDLEEKGKHLPSPSFFLFLPAPPCAVGHNVASMLNLEPRDGAWIHIASTSFSVSAFRLPPSGGPEDNQIFCPLRIVQMFLGKRDRISLVQLSVPGTAQQIDRYIAALQRRVPEAQVRPIRQFTEGEAKIYDRISGLLTATVGIVLLLTGLCVMAAMTNVAMERRNDVGLMKAIGGATRRVLRLFMMEAALLGLAGGVIGGAAGIFLSVWLGKQVFGVAAEPRLIVYPVSVALTTIVAILSAYPLRRLASVRPASVFRGEA
jgi:putative ABC transport system permease protein